MNVANDTPVCQAVIALALDAITVRYGQRLIVAELALTLQGGEVLVVAGDNGSGKSTLLRVLAGLQRPTSGVVRYTLGQASYTAHEARALLGWVAPDLVLYRDLSARENLRFFAALRGLDRSDDDLDELLATVDLAGRGDDLLASYSSGMTQRLRYAYALLHAPPVLLLDEPTVTLDAGGAALVADLIARQRAQGLTVIATNEPSERRWGDYVLTLGARR
jgi:heme exporter protein A